MWKYTRREGFLSVSTLPPCFASLCRSSFLHLFLLAHVDSCHSSVSPYSKDLFRGIGRWDKMEKIFGSNCGCINFGWWLLGCDIGVGGAEVVSHFRFIFRLWYFSSCRCCWLMWRCFCSCLCWLVGSVCSFVELFHPFAEIIQFLCWWRRE